MVCKIANLGNPCTFEGIASFHIDLSHIICSSDAKKVSIAVENYLIENNP